MEEKGKSSTGLDENVAAFLCYLFGFISGIVFLVLEKDSKYVKFHAAQSTITFLIIFVGLMILGHIPIIGWLLWIPVWIGAIILWIILIIKALKGEWYEVPIIGKSIGEKYRA